MSKPLVRLSVPPRLLDEMMLQKHAAFDIPQTEAGVEFCQWWKTAASPAERDALMRTAYRDGISLLEARQKKGPGKG